MKQQRDKQNIAYHEPEAMNDDALGEFGEFEAPPQSAQVRTPRVQRVRTARVQRAQMRSAPEHAPQVHGPQVHGPQVHGPQVHVHGSRVCSAQVREQRAESEGRPPGAHSLLFESLTDPVLLEDDSGRIVDVNPAAEQALGRSRAELLGRLGLTVYGWEGDAELESLRAACLQRAEGLGVHTVLQRGDGRAQPAQLTWLRLDGQEGHPGWLAVQIRERADEWSAAQVRRAAARQRDEFLAMLSHELRNPLAVIRNATQVMVAGGAESASTGRCEQVILRQVDHMAGLLGNLLDASRVTRGTVVLEWAQVDLRKAVEDAVEAVVASARRRQQEVVVSLPREPLWVKGDPARLRQIHENLLNNAVKYTPVGGRVGLRLVRQQDEAVVQVTDNGRGIAADQLESIFELFVQSTPELARSDGGMGIGLTLVRSLVGLHGGRVTARSDGTGRGSQFEVRLPLDLRGPLLQRDEQERSMQGDQRSSRSLEARDILVIEDNADARETLQLLLELDGHRVRVAGDGEEGLAAIEQHAPQIAFVDIGLPRVDGFELARRVRARGGHDKLRLIALTGYGRTEDRQAIEEAGFDMHLVKPVSHEALRGAIAASAD